MTSTEIRPEATSDSAQHGVQITPAWPGMERAPGPTTFRFPLYGEAQFTPQDSRKYQDHKQRVRFTAGQLRLGRNLQTLIVAQVKPKDGTNESVYYLMVMLDGEVRRYEGAQLEYLLRDARYSETLGTAVHFDGLTLHYAHRISRTLFSGHVYLPSGAHLSSSLLLVQHQAMLEQLGLTLPGGAQ